MVPCLQAETTFPFHARPGYEAAGATGLSGERAVKSRTMRYRQAALLLTVLIATTPAHAWCIWGFGQCAPSLVGEYVLEGNPVARLTITPDKITSTVGPVSFTADYVVKSFNRNNVTIELSLPEEKQTVDVIVEKDQIMFGARQLIIPGVWKKQAASR